MTCHDFERLWTARPADELPAALREHLAACPMCGAMARADRATDARLRQIGATPPAVDLDLARAGIRQKLSAGPARRAPWFVGRRPLVMAAAGLATAAVAAALLVRPGGLSKPDRSRVALTGSTPGPKPQPAVESPEEKRRRPGGFSNRPGGRGDRSAPQSEAQPERRRFVGTPRVEPPGSPAQKDTPSAGPFEKPVAGSDSPDEDAGPRQVVIIPDPSLRSASEGKWEHDLLRLNEGPLADVQPAAPLPPAPVVVAPPPVEVRRRGSVLVDDLLHLNPVRVAAVDGAGLGAALRAAADQDPATDPRLQQRVTVHAADERLADLLAWLSKATGVTLLPRMEVADERLSLWAEERALIDVMRDLRHLRGLYWSRAIWEGRWVYSLWQDAQGQAREEAELQRLAIEHQQRFRENLQKRVRALSASEADLRRMGREEPYLAAQMLHPVVRNGYRLFAALAPDQQVQIIQGATPSHTQDGFPLKVFPLDQFTFYPAGPGGGQTVFINPEVIVTTAPRGDIVTLQPGEMTREQRAAVAAILRGALEVQQKEKERDPWQRSPSGGSRGLTLRALEEADLASASVSLFRWGDPTGQGLSLRVEFRSGDQRWGVYSNIAPSLWGQKVYNEIIRKGEFELWQGAQKELDHFLGGRPPVEGAVAPAPGDHPDPILDARVTFTWRLPRRGSYYLLHSDEVLAALHRELGHPLALVGMAPVPRSIQEKEDAEFRWQGGSVRELLHRFFPGWEVETEGGALFLRDPDRLRARMNALPSSVTQFLDGMGRPFSLDDMVLLARSLTPWQIVKLQGYLPQSGIDQLLAAQELLKLYGELAPIQRAALRRGLAFTALTPTQQALFVQLAQRRRPFLEPWRIQEGGVRLTLESVAAPVPEFPRPPGMPPLPTPKEQAVFEVRFHGEDGERFPVGFYPPRARASWNPPLSALVGQPFPFPDDRAAITTHDGYTWRPPLMGLSSLGKPLLLVLARSYAEPYAGPAGSDSTTSWSRALAARLQQDGITVVQLSIGSEKEPAAPAQEFAPPNWSHRIIPGYLDGAPFVPWIWDWRIRQYPTVFLIGADGVVRAVFEGPGPLDAAAIERAAHQVSAAPTTSRK